MTDDEIFHITPEDPPLDEKVGTFSESLKDLKGWEKRPLKPQVYVQVYLSPGWAERFRSDDD